MINNYKAMSCAAYCKLKTNREEHITKYAGSIDAYVKKKDKIGRSNGEKGGGKQKKQDPQ